MLLKSVSNLLVLRIDCTSPLDNYSFISIVSILFSRSLIVPETASRRLRRLLSALANIIAGSTLLFVLEELASALFYLVRRTRSVAAAQGGGGGGGQRGGRSPPQKITLGGGGLPPPPNRAVVHVQCTGLRKLFRNN